MARLSVYELSEITSFESQTDELIGDVMREIHLYNAGWDNA
jgi:hypothetical protein